MVEVPVPVIHYLCYNPNKGLMDFKTSCGLDAGGMSFKIFTVRLGDVTCLSCLNQPKTHLIALSNVNL